MTRTRSGPTLSYQTTRPDLPVPRRGPYRNPLLYARELQAEMLRDHLTRAQLGQRHGVTSDRITQLLCLLKLPEEKQREIEAPANSSVSPSKLFGSRYALQTFQVNVCHNF